MIRASRKSENSGSPKYEALVRALRAQIQTGVLRPGDRLPTLSAMRATQNVSRPTVEKAYAILAAQGLIERQHGMSAVVASPQVVKATAGVLGLCGFQGLGSSAYWTDLVDGINHQAQSTGAQVLLLPYHVGEGWEKVDGVILCDWLNTYYQRSIPSELPLVSLFVSQQNWQRSSVAADEYSGVRQAIQYLASLGHERIGYLHGQDQGILEPRLKGYRDALREAGIVPKTNWLRSLSGKNDYGPQSMEAGRRETALWLRTGGAKNWENSRCTALLCHNDETAIGAMQAFRENGLRVPEDVSVIGFDGTAIGEYSSPRLTSIALPLRRMGEVAVEVLQRQIKADEIIVENRVLPTRLLERNSTAKI